MTVLSSSYSSLLVKSLDQLLFLMFLKEVSYYALTCIYLIYRKKKYSGGMC